MISPALPLLLLAPLAAARGQERGDTAFWGWVLERLDSPDETVREGAAASLLKEGEAAVPRVLEGFADASERSRRERARIVRQAGGEGALDAVRGLLRDPDPGVRREWAGFLGRADLPRVGVPGRAEDLGALARDASPEVWREALAGLKRLDHPAAAAVIASLARRLDRPLRREAVAALASIASGRPFLPELALEFEATDPALFKDALPAVGEALAKLAGTPADSAVEPAFRMFARHWLDLDPRTRATAQLGFRAWYGGLNDLRLADRAALLLERMAGACGEPLPLLEELVRQHLYATRDDAAASRALERLDRAVAAAGDAEGRAAAESAHLFRGLVEMVAGRPVAADAAFRRSLEVLDRTRRENPFLGPSEEDAAALAGLEARRRLDEAASYALRGARLHALRAWNSLLHPATAGSPSAEAELRASLEAVQLEMAYGDVAHSADEVLTGQLGPFRVARFLLAPRGRSREAREALWAMEGILSRLRPREFPFVGPGNPPDSPAESASEFAPTSQVPLELASFEEQVTGDAAESLRILDRLLRLHREVRPLPFGYLVELQRQRGGLLMRMRRGEEALEALLQAARLLETNLERLSAVRGSPQELRARERLANVYVSLAVNANVVRGDRGASTEYRKRALELDPNDFNRLLYACQLARDGRAAEARASIAGVTPGINTNYNLACVHALLGDVESAFEFLRRDFEEKRAGGESVATDRDWAWNDPDLRVLRDDPRFAAIVGERPVSKQP